jgi:hypothetical protein
MIMGDADVHEFYNSLLYRYHDQLDRDVAGRLVLLLSDSKPEVANVDDPLG